MEWTDEGYWYIAKLTGSRSIQPLDCLGAAWLEAKMLNMFQHHGWATLGTDILDEYGDGDEEALQRYIRRT